MVLYIITMKGVCS